MREPETTLCEVCGASTLYLATKRCNRCWELSSRIRADPELAREILTEIAPGPRFTMRDAEMHREYAVQARDTAQQERRHFATPARRAMLRRTIEIAEWHESMAERIEAWIHFNG